MTCTVLNQPETKHVHRDVAHCASLSHPRKHSSFLLFEMFSHIFFRSHQHQHFVSASVLPSELVPLLVKIRVCSYRVVFRLSLAFSLHFWYYQIKALSMLLYAEYHSSAGLLIRGSRISSSFTWLCLRFSFFWPNHQNKKKAPVAIPKQTTTHTAVMTSRQVRIGYTMKAVRVTTAFTIK